MPKSPNASRGTGAPAVSYDMPFNERSSSDKRKFVRELLESSNVLSPQVSGDMLTMSRTGTFTAVRSYQHTGSLSYMIQEIGEVLSDAGLDVMWLGSSYSDRRGLNFVMFRVKGK